MDKGVSRSFLERHRPSLLVLASQISAAALNGLAKFLETGDEPIHPFQVLFVRFLITGIGSTILLWRDEPSSFPWGLTEARPLFALRAAAGIFGAFGFYFSIMYLKLSEATALNFLGPLAAMILTKYMDFGTFEVIDRIGSLVALIGVVLVVQPDGLFDPKPAAMVAATAREAVSKDASQDRMMGFGFGLLSVCGGAVALTAIRCIGQRAHPLYSVNYFAWTVVSVTVTSFLLMENIHLTRSPLAWLKLTPLGVFGFTMEYLLTAGVAGDSTSAATIMIYSQVLWALLLDWVIWRNSVNLLAMIGIASVVTSLFVVSSAKEWAWLRKGKYRAIDQTAVDDDESEEEELAEMRPDSSIA
ncbi:putative membrane protein [Colletotrichum orbiculare MAFF 240422]|uniref:Membrane protein n=1 Tax=Colletotrichum orbiculare (strain 104-T / ATCC 96160 / CBS 514.97 / LARS 414 / MAFF 240422) TaxID=1213857 RepID=N4UV09_COLOR|nr:putative membrane protein [Colletotrichum orbiculare MAFF 240422]